MKVSAATAPPTLLNRPWQAGASLPICGWPCPQVVAESLRRELEAGKAEPLLETTALLQELTRSGQGS